MVKKLKYILTAILIVFSVFAVNAQEESYIVKKGDMLNVMVMGHPEFSLEKVLVLPDGYIQFPGLGSLQASGMSVKEFTALVTESVSQYVVNPVVTVFVSMLPTQVVNVVGYVNKPGQIVVFEPVNVIEAISRGGGIKNIRKCKKITIVRADQSFEQIKVKDLFKADSKQNVPVLYVGDTVYVVEPNEVNWSQLSFFTTLGYIAVNLIRILN
jgi:polysaccharide export outer membrane protein